MISEAGLKDRMLKMGIKEKDLEESFVCSSGPGGQNVNKVATCVVLKHIPSGIQVKSQDHRTQYQNRLEALNILLNKIAYQSFLKVAQQKAYREKVRRINRKKPKKIKEEVLRVKKINANKKMSRRKVVED